MKALIPLAAAALLLTAVPATAQQAEGDWQGVISTGASDLRLRVIIADTDQDGALDGTVISLDQGNAEISIETVTLDGANLTFTVPAIDGSYEAEWDDGHWVGNWSQGPASLPLTLSAYVEGEEVAGAMIDPGYRLPDDTTVTRLLDRLVDGRDGIIATAIMLEDGGARTLSSSALPDEARYEIGSITKVFTAFLLADMVIDGTVALDDPILPHLPEGSFAKAEAFKAITFADLSSHRSGLTRMPWNFFMHTSTGDVFANYGEAALIEFLQSVEATRAPGDEFEYSNTATGLLGWLLGRIDGTDFNTALDRRILTPMGLDDTSSDDDARSLTAHGASDETSSWTFDVLAGAGSLRQTPDDFARFAQILLNPGDRWQPHLDLMTSVQHDAMGGNTVGLGLFTFPVGGHDMLFHNGGTGGFRSTMWIDQKAGRAVGILVNSNAPNPDPAGRYLVSGLGDL